MAMGIIRGIFSPLVHPNTPRNILVNVAKVTSWGILGSGSVAITSAILSSCLKQEATWRALTPYVLKASLMSCGTCAAVLVFAFYRARSVPQELRTGTNYTRLNKEVERLESSLALIGFLGAAATVLARDHLKANHPTSLIAKHSYHPLLWMSLTGSILWIFHHFQNRRMIKGETHGN